MSNKIIVWNITTRCNQTCKYCFGPECDGVKDISTQEAKNKIDTYKFRGLKKIVFTGGEPLLRSDILNLIKYAKQKGFFTILHTNGILVTKDLIDKAEKYLDQINLPLDGFNELTNDTLRTRGHFQKIILCLQMLKNIDIRIIISTVVLKDNIGIIERVGDVLPNWIDKWRVFQVKDVDEKWALTYKEFDNLSKLIENKDYNFQVQFINDKSDFYKTYNYY